MCGITLIIDRNRQLSEPQVQQAVQTLKHRGPDFQQIVRIDFSWATIWLGHTRLSILDLSEASHQPIQNQDYAMVYNGEIYNFKEFNPQAKSDTQAIFQQLQPQGFNQWVHQWQGMFALGFVDKRQERVQVMRDPQGIKPLYAFDSSGLTIYTSEIKVLKSLGLAVPEWKPEHIQHYLTYKYFPVGTTPYKNVVSLKPGLVYQNDVNGNQEKIIPIVQSPIERKSSLVLDVEALLKASVQKHMVSDVPVGIFLSGGIDSSLLAHMAAAQGFKMPSYSISFTRKDGRLTSDALYAEKVADRCVFPWRCLSLSEKDFWSSDDWLNSMEVPIGDSAAWLSFELSRFAKREVKAVWSGAGADELFGGYNRHRGFKLYQRLANKKLLLNSGRIITKFLPERSSKVRLYRKFFNDISDDPVETWNDFCSLRIPLRQKRVNRRKVLDLKSALLDDEKNYLVQDILSLSDSMSMANSLEVRVPYLYQPLIKRVHEMSSDELMRKGGKWILKEILKKTGGGYLLKRPKEGFGAPIQEYMLAPQGQEWLASINEKHWLAQYIDIPKWNDMKRGMKSGKLNLAQELISLYVLDKMVNR